MKTLVLYKPNKKYDNFEGARMRKSIKGALELLNFDHTDSLVDYYDVAHLISPEQDSELNEIHNNGAPVVVSCLYSENDENASYLDKNPKDKSTTLTTKAIKFLSKADLILVPTLEAKLLLVNSGIKNHIEVCYPGVNMSRFDFSKEEEKEIFYRYYREDKNKKLVITVGDYLGKMEGISSFINAAKKSPDAIFYYMGRYNFNTHLNLRVKKSLNKAPKNVKFVDIPPDDVYRSALLNADVFMATNYHASGVISLVEAMAAKVQIIARKQAVFSDLLQDGETAYLGEFSETLSSLTRDYLEGKIKPTILKAYTNIQEHDLLNYGNDLVKYYQMAVSENVHRRN